MNALEPLKASLVEAEFRLVIANVTTETSVLDGITKKKFAKRRVVNQAIGLAIRICWKLTDLCNLFLKILFKTFFQNDLLLFDLFISEWKFFGRSRVFCFQDTKRLNYAKHRIKASVQGFTVNGLEVLV